MNDRVLVTTESDLDREFLELLTTATPAGLAALTRIMQAEAERIGLNLAEVAQ